MKVLDDETIPVTNYEVLMRLRGNKDNSGENQSNLATISYEISQYLEGTPCVHQSREGIYLFLDAMKPYSMTKDECMGLINFPPKNAHEIYLMIDDCTLRYTEKQLEEILQIVKNYLTGSVSDEEDEDDDEGDDDEDEEEEDNDDQESSSKEDKRSDSSNENDSDDDAEEEEDSEENSD